MKKRILSILISGVLLFGTVFANAVSIDENSNPEATTRITEILATEMIPHIHTGNSTSGGGCYTVPVYYVHNNACYKKCPGGTNQWLYDSGPDDHLHWNDYGFCNVCGGYIFRNSEDISWVMDSVESERIDCLNRLQAVQEQQLNEKKIYQMLLEFDRIYDKLSMDEQRSVLQSLISEIQLYKKDEIKESKTYIKKIKFAFDIENIGEILDNKGNHVEAVCLLSN